MQKTKLFRLYPDDVQEVKIKFPKLSAADCFHTAIKTNPFFQLEAFLRGKNVKK